jgi:molecular chaperone HtpG
MKEEKKEFSAEVDKILNLMIHSLYRNKEIFMRELISNASDACDNLRYLSQTNPALIKEDPDFKITIRVNKDNRSIIIRDNGIGMNREDLIENLGTIAKSGTQKFLSQLSGDAKKDNMLIGQFGVGFYSAFMIADYVTVTSRKAGEEKIYIWHSDGRGEYTISNTDKDFTRGTEIVIHVKDEEDSYLDDVRLKHIVKTYSDHIAIPIYFIDVDNNENQLNSSSALWIRPKSEVTEDQYKEFYKSFAYSMDEPWLIMHNRNEGKIEFTNLLFIPSTKPFDLFNQNYKKQVKLYIKRVFISDENIDLIPDYLRFLRGVVDSEDLPLNISRETLQHNIVLEKIKASITKKVLNELSKKKKDDIEDYLKFWNNFGVALKEGLCEISTDHEKLLEVCMFRSSINDKLISLDQYIENCREDQKVIYYLSGKDHKKLLSSPHIEGFLSKNIDVLLLTDTVDNFWVKNNNKYKDYEIKSATGGNIDLEKSENQGSKKEETKNDKKEDKKYDKLIAYFKEVLGDLVKDVKISKKLTTSLACFTENDSTMDFQMGSILGQDSSFMGTNKILELNAKHKIIKKLNSDLKNKDKENNNEQLVRLIFDQVCIVEGQPIHDATAFAKRFDNVLEKITL